MTAKELKDKAKVTNHNAFGNHLVGYYVFGEEEMAIFWSQLCKEQREICAKSFHEWDDKNFAISHDVINAPEPEIE